ncbi:metal ABC transporter substrate-binding protein [uncultured Tessaracoccus sp.]|uniref:metal ABC transporter substrate-binding protein n=1 Tax=uncultured Tessaracoccus sp. TaxID=905023 RepID=UPI0025D22D7A|nr:metal ABC transporter substrate-binding protein [uncultured Tessaracoccus sp.]
MPITRRLAATAAALAIVATAGCAVDHADNARPSTGAAGGVPSKLSVVATTGYLGDAVHNIAPDADVAVLVGPGGDPHTQALTTADAERLEAADVVVWTSHDMEHQMMDQLDALGAKQVAAGEAIPDELLLPWEEDGKVEGHDPHVWNSPEAWTHVVTATADKLAEVDAANADTYRANAKAYNTRIRDAEREARASFEAIPKAQRVLVTGHDAFNYLGKTFDIEIHATDFVSSEAQMSAVEIDELASLIADKHVGVIFQDNLSNPEAITHVKEAVKAKGGHVEIADTPLYADSLGESAPTDTYLGAFQYNVEQMVAAFKKAGK